MVMCSSFMVAWWWLGGSGFRALGLCKLFVVYMCMRGDGGERANSARDLYLFFLSTCGFCVFFFFFLNPRVLCICAIHISHVFLMFIALGVLY